MSLRFPVVALACMLCALPGAPAAAASFTGVVSHVTDGDSLWVRPAAGGAPRQLRLQGIDAPEICQAWGPQARDALARRVLHRQVSVRTHASDSYNRPVGRLNLAGQDMGGWMVRHGHAWARGYRQHRGPYAAQEAQARQARLGLWAAAAPVDPKLFRKNHGSCRSPLPPAPR